MMKPVPPESCFWSSSSSTPLRLCPPSGPKKNSNGSWPSPLPKWGKLRRRLSALMMSVAVTETIAGETCSAMSANDSRAIICGARTEAASAAAGAAAVFLGDARFVKARGAARIIPKTTEPVRRAASDKTFVFVRIPSIDDRSSSKTASAASSLVLRARFEPDRLRQSDISSEIRKAGAESKSRMVAVNAAVHRDRDPRGREAARGALVHDAILHTEEAGTPAASGARDLRDELRATEDVHDVEPYVDRYGGEIRVARAAEDFRVAGVHGDHVESGAQKIARDRVRRAGLLGRAAHDGDRLRSLQGPVDLPGVVDAGHLVPYRGRPLPAYSSSGRRL